MTMTTGMIILLVLLGISIILLVGIVLSLSTRIGMIEDQQDRFLEVSRLMQSAHDTTCEALDSMQQLLEYFGSEAADCKGSIDRLLNRMNRVEDKMKELESEHKY